MSEEIKSRLYDLLKENSDLKVPIKDINQDIDLISIGINSLSFIKAMVIIEEEFGLELNDEDYDYSRFKTVKDLTLFIEDKIPAKVIHERVN